MSTLKVKNATAVCNYFDRNMEDSGIFVQFIDFDKIEISLSEDYDGTISDAENTILDLIFRAKL
jgi:hypothetical protein